MRSSQMTLAPNSFQPTNELDLRELGEVFTQPWVVDFMLDAAGYVPEADLISHLAVEPACGTGAFLVPMVQRLAESARIHGKDLADAADSLRAFDLNEESVKLARAAVHSELVSAGLDGQDARTLADEWVVEADYLLEGLSVASEANFVIGNPPYIRLEAVPSEVRSLYRQACSTMRGRADVYVGFIETGLRSLQEGGVLCFICADRWMRNGYGSALREFIANEFSVDLLVQAHDADVFENEVSAYPAIVAIRKGSQGQAAVVRARQSFDFESSVTLRARISDGAHSAEEESFSLTRMEEWFEGRAPWPDVEPRRLELLRRLEEEFLPLEDESTGTRVGIGVATGADEIFITKRPLLIEPERLLPLVMSDDLAGPEVRWSGSHLVNPWEERGLVDLEMHPLLRAYLVDNSDLLKRRYVASKQPDRWYRTIDRVRHDLVEEPKLLLPDIKAEAHPALDPGGHYPHHNLYYITSDVWDLSVLGGLLLSQITQLFVEAYSVRMRGGYLRFQAQNLRRLRIPKPTALSSELKEELTRAFTEYDRSSATDAACEAYGVERKLLDLQ